MFKIISVLRYRQNNAVRYNSDNIVVSPSILNLLGITVDAILTLEKHIKLLCKKGSNKLCALSRLSYYLNRDKLIILLNAFVISQFGYCPLVWSFCKRSSNRKINSIQEKALRLIDGDYTSSFDSLLSKYGAITVHNRKLHCLI